MRKLSPILAVLLTLAILGADDVPRLFSDAHNHALPMTAYAQTDPTCSEVPRGALAPARPTWCSPTTSGPATFTQSANSWLDNWEHGLSNASLGSGYRDFTFGRVPRQAHWRHLNHWMVDVEGAGVKGGGMMRPDRSFKAENGKLVIEVEVAPSISTYNIGTGDVWPEIVVTTAPAPTQPRRDSLYAYDEFANHWTFGCRLHPGQVVICAMFDNTAGGPGDIGPDGQHARRYESSWFQQPGATSYGGEPGTDNNGQYWKVCAAPDNPDVICRNTFRLELTATTIKLLVNGHRYFEQTGLPPYLGNLTNGQDVYTYMGSVVYQYPKVARFHWDHLAVNPGAAGPPPTPTSVALPTGTPTTTAPPCEVRVRISGVESWLAKPAAFCQ